MQAFVGSTMCEVEYGDAMGARDSILTNGSAQIYVRSKSFFLGIMQL